MGNYDYQRKKSAPCNTCMKALKWIPVLFIGAVIAWSYYAYVVQLCIFSIENVFEKTIFLIFYHVIFFLFVWSYWNTIFTPAGKVPSNWRIPETELERIFHAENQEQQRRILESCAKSLPVSNRTLSGLVRFCEKCRIIKPDRAHHCSVCGACVLKMDHHCPWVNNCVNFTNYKFFILFLGYALLYCLYVALTSLENFIKFWRGELNGGMGRFHILFLFFVAVMFAISLVSLFGYHVYLVLMNRTTLEAFRAPIFRIGGPDKNGFNLGKYANFQEVFGDNWKLWFLPVYTSLGDGLQCTTRTQQQNYHSMGDTQTSPSQQQLSDALMPHSRTQTTTNDELSTTTKSNTSVLDPEFSPRSNNSSGGSVVIDMRITEESPESTDTSTNQIKNKMTGIETQRPI
ncbi:palmitoyltransferase ZDHHC20-B isoform X2 [Teleopsis dalmanni]|uniref:palmitoyltransferase ZDHHC20-B isoform X2 n=1 Tax=Teleopsis dalmanni TaxID=139649 RepID=UPI0018CE6E54|nr:palmitoyltransferase ZDHHC20-B isoform X2 [Teleopsis dalmanni]XP_037945629.1 palmitoyltransferase ZDHHC20-B isoform X2 [Teleopsis dalmanni]